MEQQVIGKLNSFITELEGCNINNEYEDIKSRIKSYVIGLYGNNHSLSKAEELNEEFEESDYDGLFSYPQNGTWINTSAPENRPLTKDKSPLIIHISKIVGIINKDGLPLNMKPTVMINMEHCQDVNVAAGNIGNTNQSNSVSMSNFNNCYEQTLMDIERTAALTEDQKEELLDMLALYKESINREETPRNTVLKSLGKYSHLVTTIGANMVTLWGFIEPYVNQLPK